jgi:MinD-like ATPase involved in chromosome partitioning or flagellar assembly
VWDGLVAMVVGKVIDVSHEMNPKTHQRFYEIAAAIAEHFSDTVTLATRVTGRTPFG